MLPHVRRRRFAVAAVAVVGAGVLGCIALLATLAFVPGTDNATGKGDPDPQGNSIVAVCSDVPFRVQYTANLGSKARPDMRKFSQKLEPTAHDRDPFDTNGHKRCAQFGSAFGSRVNFKAPGLNDGQPFAATAATDRRHWLVVRLTKNADNTVTGARETVSVPASHAR